MGVGAGVRCHLNRRSCTHVCVSIGLSRFQMILNSCMWDHDFPVGIAPTEDEQALPMRHFCPSGGCSLFSFLLTYSTCTNLLTIVCELTGQCKPNLLPVAGGGTQPSRYVLLYRMLFPTSRILFRGHSAFMVFTSVTISVTLSVIFQERLRTIYLEVSYPFQLPIHLALISNS